jgi:hypothetical protein
MPPREEMLRCMQERAATVVPDGEPIIRDGPIATTQDIQEFKSLVEALGYSVKFGQSKSVTKPGNQRVELEAARTLSRRFGLRQRAPSLGSTLRISGSSNDRRFHQLELGNCARYLEQSGEAIPLFIWRTFSQLKRAMKAASGSAS